MLKKNNSEGKKTRINLYVFSALFCVSFSVLLFSSRGFVIDIRDTGLSVFSSVRGGVASAASIVSRTVNSVGELSALHKNYRELADKISRYEELERSAAEIRQENYRLREQLGFRTALRYKHIPAELIGRDPDNLFHAFVINKGTKNGVKKDMPVIAYYNGAAALVGKVINASARESFVLPIYDERCFVAARFAQSRHDGIVVGEGSYGKPLLMQSIGKNAYDSVKTGDVIVSSGLGGVYPAGFNIGRVSNIIIEDYKTYFEVELESSIDFSRLEYVFVIEKEEVED